MIRFLTILLLATPAWADDYVPPRSLGCMPHDALGNTITPPELARVVRACVNADEMENAFAIWLSFNSYALFDQQRVKDESAHMVLQDLYSWTFTGYERAVLQKLKGVADAYRDRDGELFQTACATIVETGQPEYRPTYMISSGIWPLKHPEDWKTEDFDPDAAWRKAVVEINGCPEF